MAETTPGGSRPAGAGDGVVYPHGIEQRFQRYHLDKVFPTLADLTAASQRMQFMALKYEIEQMRLHPSIVGYVITEFTDVHWECNGLLDMCRNPKIFHDVIGRPQRRRRDRAGDASARPSGKASAARCGCRCRTSPHHDLARRAAGVAARSLAGDRRRVRELSPARRARSPASARSHSMRRRSSRARARGWSCGCSTRAARRWPPTIRMCMCCRAARVPRRPGRTARCGCMRPSWRRALRELGYQADRRRSIRPMWRWRRP